MGKVLVAGNRILQVVHNLTWLEAIHDANKIKRKIMPKSFFNRFVGRNNFERFDRIFEPKIEDPLDVPEKGIIYTGTIFAIGQQGAPLHYCIAGVVKVCMFDGKEKEVVITPEKRHARLLDTAILCDHGFAPDGTPFLQLFNAETKKPILTDEEMSEAEIVLLKLNGRIYTRKFPYRELSENPEICLISIENGTHTYVDFSIYTEKDSYLDVVMEAGNREIGALRRALQRGE